MHAANPLDPFAMWPAFPPSAAVVTPATTTSPPPHPGGISRRRAFPPASGMLTGEGATGMVPTFTANRSSG